MKTKKIFFASILALLALNVNSQTNTFPASGNVGIGTISPGKTLDVVGTARFTGNFDIVNGVQSLTATNATMFFTRTDNTSSAPSLWGVKTRGNYSTTTQNGDGLLFIGGRGYDGSVRSGASAMFGFRAAETWNSTSHGSYITFEVTPNGATSRITAVQIANDGNVGIGTTTPSEKLHVDGNLFVTDGIKDSSGDLGTSGQILSTTGTGTNWINAGAGSSNQIADLVDGNTRIIAENDSIQFYIAGTEKLRFNGKTLETLNNGQNIFIGIGAGQATGVSDNHNVCIGDSSGYFNSGWGNSFFGYQSGRSNTTGYMNTFLGRSSGYANTAGNDNLFLGAYCGFTNTTGSSNIFLGNSSGYANTIGNENLFAGYSAGTSNTTGSSNSFLGYFSGLFNTTGNNNTFIGFKSGYSNTVGDSSVFIGYEAGYNETASQRLYIENSSSATPLIYGEFDNDILRFNGDVGINAAPTGGYALYVNGTTYCTSGSWTASDKRYKKGIKTINSALEKVKSMRGANYEFQTGQFKNKNFSEEKQYGFIAQELKEVLPELVKEDEDGFYAVNYDGVIPVLVEAMKEQDSKIGKQDGEIKKLKEQNDKFEKEIAELKELLTTNPTQNNTVFSDGEAILYQNNPNPFNKQTEIQYYLSTKISSAAILIFDMNGKQLKSYTLAQRGGNKLVINGGEFVAGMYIYSLIADGKIIDTKKMILNQLY